MDDEDTYKIIRFYAHRPSEVIATGLTLDEAQAHCTTPETSWKTCQSAEGQARTKQMGPWFDGWTKE